MTTTPDTYPVSYDVDYPDVPLNRLTTFFRILWAIPIIIVVALLAGGGGGGWEADPDTSRSTAQFAGAGGGFLFLPVLLMLLFRQKYPRWWFDWNLAFTRFGARVNSYIALLRDEYPSTDEEQAVHLDFTYPDAATDLNRWLPLVKWLLAIPHWILLFFLAIGAFFAVVIAWFAILFTGRYPRTLFDYVVGVQRWSYRVVGYALILVTDRYPPFSLR